jgi:hypothetical protein
VEAYYEPDHVCSPNPFDAAGHSKVSFESGFGPSWQTGDGSPESPPTQAMKAHTISQSKKTTLLTRVCELYTRQLSKAQSHLAELGLDSPRIWERFQLGYGDGSLASILPDDGIIFGELRQLGLVDENGHELFAECVTCPLLDAQGLVVGIAGWPVANPRESRWLPDDEHIWNLPVVQASDDLIATYSVPEALGLLTCDIPNVVALRDARAVDTELRLGTKKLGVTIVRGSQEATSHVNSSPEGNCPRILSIEAASINEYIARNGPDELARIVRDHISTADVARAGTAIPDGFELKFKTRRYEVRGLEKSQRVLRATVMVEHAGRLHIDTVNLYGARERQRLTAGVARLCGEERPIIESEVERILAVAEKRSDQTSSTGKPSAANAVVLSEADREAADRFARSPDLIEQIIDDFDRCGLVGERNNKLLCYAAMTSRKLDNPISVLILASSGAGKSALQDATISFCPPEDLVKLTSLSGKALFYGDQHGLKQKVLAVEEGDGLASAAYSLRTLISAGELVVATTGRSHADGRLRGMSNRVEGPTAVFLTSTDPDLDPETKSRFLVTSVDESRQQTLAVLAWQRKLNGPSGLTHRTERSLILQKHWAFQRLLEPVRVVNPLAEQLEFGDDRLASRREQPKFLRLVSAIALLRQRQKPLKFAAPPESCPYIEVDAEDVRIAKQISAGVFRQSLGDVSGPGFELLRVLDQMRREKAGHRDDFTFSRREIRDFARWSNGRIHRYLHELLEFEYVERIGRCGWHRYTLKWDGVECSESSATGFQEGTDRRNENILISFPCTAPAETPVTL